MKKIIHIPLDERPCNYDFPYEMFKGSEFDIVRVPFEYMGLKKKKGDIEKIIKFVQDESRDSYAAIISLDTFLYGGIVPSRLHYYSFDEIKERLDILKDIKKNNPNIKLYCYNLVMRCPSYSDDDEEPFYYQYFGEAIHKKKSIEHKMMMGLASEDEKKYFAETKIPDEYIKDYESRREINTRITCEAVNLVHEGVIDFLIVPQDDSAPYGYTALDQIKVRSVVSKYHLENLVMTYPGADEVSNTLFAKMLNEYYGKKPLVYVKYPSDACKMIIPLCEDRPLDMSVRSQIIASGALYCDSLEKADLVLAINAPAKYMCSRGFEEYADYFSYGPGRNLNEFVEFIQYAVSIGKKVTVCDIGYANGADPALIDLFEQYDMYYKLSGYASWNIPCNTLGTALPMGIKAIYPHNEEDFRNFLTHRFVEDVGYCGLTRKIIRATICTEEYGLGYTIYDTHSQRDEKFTEYTLDVLNKQLQERYPKLYKHYTILDAYFPWSRTYEIGLKVIYK